MNRNQTKTARAALFNFKNFKDPRDTRSGSEEDVKKLEECLPRRCETSAYEDLTTSGFRAELHGLAKENFSHADYFLCFFSSHGKACDIMVTKDDEMSAREIIEIFNDENCPNLRGKPKIFFFQMCRGESLDAALMTVTDIVQPNQPTGVTDAARDPTPVSTQASQIALFSHQLQYLTEVMPSNCLVVFSTTPGWKSIRNKKKGGYFIHYVTEALMQHRELPITEVLTQANCKMARELSRTITIKKTEGVTEVYKDCKQMGVFISSLQTKVFL